MRTTRFSPCAALVMALVPWLSPKLMAQTTVTPVHPVPIAPVCAFPVDPIPSGISDRPGDSFNIPPEEYYVHADTHHQGLPAREKWAWGFFPTTATPHAEPIMRGFRTLVVVNNPNEFPITVDIEYRSTAGGAPIATNTVTIPIHGFHTELASPLGTVNGAGSIRVLSNPSYPTGPFVGGTVHQSYIIGSVTDPSYNPFAPPPGLASHQQLEVVQPNKTTLYLGPLVASTVDPYTFNLGMLHTFQVINPNNAPNNLVVTLQSPGLGVFSYPLVLPPFGSTIDMTLFNVLLPAYLTPGFTIDENVVVTVQSTDGLPILGEALLLNLFGPGLVPGGRFRMASIQMMGTPSRVLYNPDLIFTTTGPMTQALMGISNLGAVDAGPVTIQYWSQSGGSLGTDTIASLPPGTSLRIAPGEPGILNYPVGVTFGTARIIACAPIFGHTVRQVEGGGTGYRKAFGEELDGTNGVEPGRGVRVNLAAGPITRKVAPLQRIASQSDSPNWWPGYEAISNWSVANIGRYTYRFFWSSGFETTNPLAPQPFLGLPFSEESFTYIDGNPRLATPPVTSNHHGYVDHDLGSIKGISVIGDPLWEWDLGFPKTLPPVYEGPQDIVPPSGH